MGGFRGTNPGRHPWFLQEQVAERPVQVVEHHQVSKNYGLLGGYLDVRFLTTTGGDGLGRVSAKVIVAP